jgi:hypothetical protein
VGRATGSSVEQASERRGRAVGEGCSSERSEARRPDGTDARSQALSLINGCWSKLWLAKYNNIALLTPLS